MPRDQVRENEPGTVGGGVQVAYAVPDGFHLSVDAQPFGQSRFADPFSITCYRGLTAKWLAE